MEDFAGGPVVMNSLANAPSLVWEDPTCRRITKPVRHSYRACGCGDQEPHPWEPVCSRPLLCNKEEPLCAATRESPRAATKTQHSQREESKILS